MILRRSCWSLKAQGLKGSLWERKRIKFNAPSINQSINGSIDEPIMRQTQSINQSNWTNRMINESIETTNQSINQSIKHSKDNSLVRLSATASGKVSVFFTFSTLSLFSKAPSHARTISLPFSSNILSGSSGSWWATGTDSDNRFAVAEKFSACSFPSAASFSAVSSCRNSWLSLASYVFSC